MTKPATTACEPGPPAATGWKPRPNYSSEHSMAGSPNPATPGSTPPEPTAGSNSPPSPQTAPASTPAANAACWPSPQRSAPAPHWTWPRTSPDSTAPTPTLCSPPSPTPSLLTVTVLRYVIDYLRQTVAIARAIAMEPEALLFDEPTSALDPELVSEVLDVMGDLARSGMTMIVVTHEIGFARHVADRAIFMDHGVIVEQGAARAVLDTPANPRTQSFLSKVMH